MTRRPALPVPPLPHRRLPTRLVLRGTLWRARFVLAAVLAGVTVATVVHALGTATPRTVTVVVAARDLPAGTTLATSDLLTRHVPATLAVDAAASDPQQVLGASTAVPLTPGSPLVPGVLAAAEVRGPPGTVVAAVRLADPALGRLLHAGDRVDVLAATPESRAGTVVASRALILPSPVPDAEADGLLGGLGAGGLGPGAQDEAPVLVAVTPREAEALAGAAASAMLSAVVVP